MSLITPDFGLIFWMTLIFAVLFFVLAKFGFPMITCMVDRRSERIEDGLKKAEEAETRLALVALEQQALIEEARAEQGRMLKEAARTRDEIIAQARQAASEQAADMIAKAKTQIEAEKQTALAEIRSEVAALSLSVAGKIVRRDLADGDEQTRLINALVEEAANSELHN